MDSSQTRRNPGGTALETAIQAFLRSKSKANGTGNYRSNLESCLSRWQSWAADRDVTSLDAVDDQLMRRYAQRLARREAADAISAATARTYYHQIAAFLSWCVEDGRLATNPAERTRAKSELPEDDGRRDSQQFWTQEARQQLVEYVTARARSAVDVDPVAPPDVRRARLRDRALVTTLAYSGARGAEILRDPNDEREGRQGLTWSNVDLTDGTLYVLGKSQEWEYAPLTETAATYLGLYKRVVDPPRADWPVFVSRHRPSLYRAAREALAGAGVEDVDAVLEDLGPMEALREYGGRPPALSTAGGRSILQRLCEDAGVSVDGEYLKPHGARRGLGDALYRESAELAQDALRHQSVETTHEAYSHVEAAELGEEVGEILDE